MPKMPTVTASWMLTALEGDNRNHVIGRALSAIDANDYFTANDKRNGHISALYYNANQALLPWVVDMWMKVEESTGLPRIVKYHSDLDAIAKRIARKKYNDAIAIKRAAKR